MVLLTGATGFIGKNFALEYTKKKQIKILVRYTSDISIYRENPAVLISYGNLLRDDGLDSALEGVECVIHCAARTTGRNFYEFYQANTIVTENLIQAMKRKGVSKILFISSQSAGGSSRTKEGVKESIPSRPISFYGLSKKMAEDIVIESGLSYTILRPCAVYGPYDMEILKFIKLLENRIFPIIGIGKKYLNLIYVKDLVSLMEMIVENSIFNNKIYYVSDGICYEFEEVVKEICRILKKDWYIKINFPVSFALIFGLMNDLLLPQKKRLVGYDKIKEMSENFWVCESSEVIKEIGWQPVHCLNKGMEETILWYQKKGYLFLD